MDEIEAMRSFRAGEDPKHSHGMTHARNALRNAMSQGTGEERRQLRTRLTGGWVFPAIGAIAIGLIVTLVVIADSNGNTRQRGISADAQSIYPYDTASDVVSYADQVSVVTAIDSKDIPDENVDPDQAKADGFLVSRAITFRVDQTVWRRAGAPALGKACTAVATGWRVKGESRTKFNIQGMPWIEVGSQYLAPLAFDGTTCTLLQAFDLFPVEASIIKPQDDQQRTRLARMVSGLTTSQVATIFAAARPDPLAAEHFNLLPRARVNAVAVARQRHGG